MLQLYHSQQIVSMFSGQIVMPEFTKHCKLCEVCIESLDHHCLFLMNCVARNNHRAFVCFMTEILVANALFVRAAVSCELSL